MGFFGLFSSKVSFNDCGILQGASDSHSHILFGVDDGIKTMEDSLAAIAAEESMGISHLWCTPHIMEDVPNNLSKVEVLKFWFIELPVIKASY